MKFCWFTILSILTLTSGCAFAPQAVEITTTVEVYESEVGADHAVQLNVIDERPQKTLGTRGVRGVGADLTLAGDLKTTVHNAISDGLKRKKFKLFSESNPENREMRVEIRNLDYEMIMGFWAGTLKVNTSLKAICIRGSQRAYEKLHRGEVAESVQVVQSDEANNRYVSQAVSAAVSSLLEDEKLINCLAVEPTVALTD